jgi:predicted RNA-binding protein with PIN domain
VVVIIDGYNLIGTERGDLEAHREQLVQSIARYQAVTGHKVTLVFDGYIDGGYGSSSMRGGLRVVYTGIGEKADQAILKMIPSGVEAAVISSDREVQAGAWAAGAVAVDSETFLRKLSAAVPDEDALDSGVYDPDEEYEEMYSQGPKRGNPRKTSKKQKALDRVLRKL